MKSLLILLFALSSIPSFLQRISKQEPIAVSGHKKGPILYKVNRIDSLDYNYIIYLVRHDSIFKVVSAKNALSKCSPIQVGRLYAFNLNKGFGFVDYEISFWNGISLDDESRHNLYEAYNLKGLCIK